MFTKFLDKYFDVIATGLVGLVVIAGVLMAHGAIWSPKPFNCDTHLAKSAYWRSPMPQWSTPYVREHLALSLSNGCWDGRKWTREEMSKVL